MSTVEEILKRRNIEPQQSHFLVKYQSYDGKEMEFDPKSKYGEKLSKDWTSKDDSVMSIGWKKLKDNIYSLLNPDTYSKTSIPSLKHWIIINQNYMILGAFVLFFPATLFCIRIFPAMRRARRQYVLHQYMRRRYFEEEFKLGHKKISRREVEDILRETHSKINI